MDNLFDATNPLDPTLDIVFVDRSVNDYQNLIDGIVPSTPGGQMMVVTLDQTLDGIQQISDTLAQYGEDQVSAIHIVSHGDAGTVQLGNSTLDHNSLGDYQDELLGWGDALTDDGDLLFYGCNVGQGSVGQNFVAQLSNVTGADIAASDDLTGNAALGGDWNLEVNTGVIEAGSVFDIATQNNYQGILLDIDDSSDQWGNTVTEGILNFKTVTSTLTFKPKDNGDIEVMRSSGSSNTLTIRTGTPQITGSGTGGSSSKDILDLSNLSATKDITLTVKNSDNKIVVVFDDKSLTFKNIKDVIGGKGNNTYNFEDGAKLQGSLTGGANNQTTAKKNEIIYLGNNNQTITFNSTNNGRDGTATTLVNGGFTKIDKVTGGSGKETITGNSNTDILLGGEGNDQLFGKANNDSLEGGKGKDTLEGGLGNDSLKGGEGDDTYKYIGTEANFGIDTITEDSTDESGTDTIDMSALTDAVTVTIDDAKFSIVKDSTNKIENIANVETFKSTKGNNTYTVTNNWKGKLVIEDNGTNGGVLDLKLVDKRFLTLKINGNNNTKNITVTDGVGNEILLKNFKEVIGGKYYNRYELDDDTNTAGNLLPFIKNPDNSINILDYKDFNKNGEVTVNLGDQSVNTTIVNLVQTELGLAKQNEVREIWTKSKEFTLKIGNKTRPINLLGVSVGGTSYLENPRQAFEEDIVRLLDSFITPAVTKGDITVVGTGTQVDPWRITFINPNFFTDSAWELKEFFVESGSSQATFVQKSNDALNQSQTIYHTGIGGKLKLQYGTTNNSQTKSDFINFDGQKSLTKKSIEEAIASIPAIANLLSTNPGANVTVTGTGTESDPWQVEFNSLPSNLQLDKLQLVETTRSDLSSPGVNIETLQPQVKPQAAEWRLWTNALNSGGNFTLSFGNKETANIAVAATPNTTTNNLRTQLEMTLGANNFTLSGNGTFEVPWIIKITDSDSSREEGIPNLTINAAGLTANNVVAESATGVSNGEANKIVSTEADLDGEITQVIGTKDGSNNIDDKILAENTSGGNAVDIAGGKGNDYIVGGQQADILSGDAGDDVIKGEVIFNEQTLPGIASQVKFNLNDFQAGNLSDFNITIGGTALSAIDVSAANNAISLVDILNNDSNFNSQLVASWAADLLTISQKGVESLTNSSIQIDEIDQRIQTTTGTASQVTINNITEEQAGKVLTLKLTVGGTELDPIDVSSATNVETLLTTLNTSTVFIEPIWDLFRFSGGAATLAERDR
jgi:hypothetical protein